MSDEYSREIGGDSLRGIYALDELLRSYLNDNRSLPKYDIWDYVILEHNWFLPKKMEHLRWEMVRIASVRSWWRWRWSYTIVWFEEFLLDERCFKQLDDPEDLDSIF